MLEYWGTVDSSFMNEIGADVEGIDELDQIQVNVWVCGNQIIRAVANPFTPHRIPFQVFPYEISP